MQGLEKLKDIKPPVEVHDTSFIIFSAILFAIAVSIGVSIYFLVKKRLKRKKRRKSERELALESIKNIDFGKTKDAVYEFSESGYVLVKDDPEKLKEFEKIVKELEKYKYKKEIEPLSKEDIKKMKDFIKVIK